MNRLLVTALASLALLACVADRASAQNYGGYGGVGGYGRVGFSPFGRPLPGNTLSPYLNLGRPGNPAINYYLGVVPERDRRTFEGQARRSILDLEQRENRPLTTTGTEDLDYLYSNLPSTGHGAAFGTVGYYFGSIGNVPRGVAGQQSGANMPAGTKPNTGRSTRSR